MAIISEIKYNDDGEILAPDPDLIAALGDDVGMMPTLEPGYFHLFILHHTSTKEVQLEALRWFYGPKMLGSVTGWKTWSLQSPTVRRATIIYFITDAEHPERRPRPQPRPTGLTLSKADIQEIVAEMQRTSATPRPAPQPAPKPEPKHADPLGDLFSGHFGAGPDSKGSSPAPVPPTQPKIVKRTPTIEEAAALRADIQRNITGWN